jgi:ribosomal protein L32
MDAPSTSLPRQRRKPEDRRDEPDVQPCPGCGQQMPALKGARLSICSVCGYKESCCY